MSYIGRFAPSPTGPLHFGSLVAAVASWLDARRHGGRWLVRMEDLDPPREVPGAADAILRSLEAFGLHWDGPVLYQSTRGEAYEAALLQLGKAGHAFDCGCSRREVAQAGLPGLDGPIYPGTCRGGLPPGKRARAARLRTEPGIIEFADRVQGVVAQDVAREVGDFVIRRADGYFAYQLAVVVDDAFQGITHVVRGLDLLDSTPRQILLQRLLGLPTPHYLHHPLVLTPEGEKLSKQTGAPPVDMSDPVPALIRALEFLGEPVPENASAGPPEAILHWVAAKPESAQR
ncbi:tRNA glutamyl-Q(34) synthetase GluQRS [Thioalkalivibrio denitrificans]|uniref:Glutamyl-Q tRNA(Asp) synthetase n=1 Tax=Thioalkalivibrio denitrificans TaxID=108003 RepID=A0A1V3NMB3_9GAMM|nr:tRNA glutamyl-Q(34) synthetase GluQRS [Thioalkalivibrio denitrificans]OOG26181.1 tRNA glutamyl-Q(34) synthetase GluQRS [Thioalkalivibrio denitrificans]